MITPKEQTEEENKIFIVCEDVPVIKKVALRKNTEIQKKFQENSNNVSNVSTASESITIEYEKLKVKYDKTLIHIEELESLCKELKNKHEKLYK